VARSLGESSPFILAALLVGLFVGWLLWGRKRAGRRPAAPGAVAVTAPSTESAAEPKPAAGARRAVGPKPDSDSDSGEESRPAAESGTESEPESRPEVVAHREPESESESADRPVPQPAALPQPAAVPQPAATSVDAAVPAAPAQPPAPAQPQAAERSSAVAEPVVPTTTPAVAVPAASVQPQAAGEPSAVPEPSTSTKRSVVAPAVVKQRAARPEPVTGTPATALPQQPGTESVPAAGTTSGPVDDLTRIEGIGPKIAAALVASGVGSYRELAGSDVETLRAALRSKGLRFVPSLPSWPEQARLLAADDTAGLAALTDRLVAGRERAAEPAASPAVPAQPQPEPSREVVSTEQGSSNGTAAGAGLSTPPDEVKPDDLKRIEGIGPKMANALNAAGITTFEGLAAADESTIRAAIAAAGLRFAPSLVTWARQARLLAAGDEEDFDRLTDDLVAGRPSGRG
jgi:predicted flap endonuclease-1-like 5' DNA nuclease